MEAVATAAAAAAMVDLNTLSRRELQALCKLNGVRANMTNLAMVEALQSLPSVDGIDQVGTTLCLPTPGKSAMKSALRTAAAAASDHQQQQQQGSPLPRGRRVSVKSPEAIRMDAEEEEEDEAKRDHIREIVLTPGVALRSTSRRPRATPAPLPTPAAGTQRRSQRSTARKATAPVEEVVVSTAKRSTRRSARSMPVISFDQEEEDAPVAQEEDKVQQVEPEGVTSDEKRDEPEEEEVTNLPEEGNSKGDEPEMQVEEGVAIGEEEKLVSAEKSAPSSAMEDSPILGVLPKAAPELAMKNGQNASTEDREIFENLSPLLEIADEIKSVIEDKEVAAVEMPEEAVKEDAFNPTIEAAAAPNKMVLAAMPEKEVPVDESAEGCDLVGESIEEADLTVDDLDAKEDDMLKADQTVGEESGETIDTAAAPNKMVPAAVTEIEVSVDELPQADLTDDESVGEYDLDGESSEVDDLDESDETIEASDSTEVNFDSDEAEEQLKMLGTGEETKEAEDSDSLTEEEDDFSTDLSSEFDDVLDFSDAETATDSPHVAPEGINAAAAAAAAASSAAKTVEAVIAEEIEVPSQGDVVSQHVETIVESLDKATITGEKKEECAKEKTQLKVGKEMSLRKLKSAYKESLIAAKEGKKLTIASDEGRRVALAELDDNADY